MKYPLLLVITCLSFFSCRSRSSTAVRTSLLWEITGKDLRSPSYLFGTMHLMCSSDLQVSGVIKKNFDRSKQLFLELDMDDPSLMLASLQGMMMKNGISLDSLLGRTMYDSVARKFRAVTGMPLSLLRKAKPMLAAAAIYPALLGCEPEGWEKRFMSMAKENRIEVKGLEEVKEQFAIFDSIPYELQAEMFATMLLNLDSTKKSFNELLVKYKQQDIEELAALSSSDKHFSAYEEVMLNTRNRNWIPVIEQQIKLMPTFIAVGAAHLGGKEGVISLLKAKGYKLKPLKL